MQGNSKNCWGWSLDCKESIDWKCKFGAPKLIRKVVSIMLKKILLSSSVLVLMSPVFAHADLIGATESFTLTVDGCTGGCGTAPFATVTLLQSATGVVTVTEVLTTTTPAEGFVGTGSGNSLEWNLKNDPTISITPNSTTLGFGPVTPKNAGGFGSFEYALDCDGLTCGPGASTRNHLGL